METFPYIAKNFIKKKRFGFAIAMSVILFCTLVVGCSHVQTNTAEDTEQTVVDAVTGAAPESHSEVPDNQIYVTDIYGNATSSEESQAVLRERSRSDADSRIQCCRECEGNDWYAISFDLKCKSNVSESKVRQGIFHFRLQSDDEEAPIMAA